MSSPARRVHYTYAEYLALEDASATKHEYFEGEIYAMAGGTPDHAALAAAIIALVAPAVTAGCRTFTSDLRVRVAATGLTTYPDAAIVCGPTLRATDDRHAVVNPIVLFEVTSSSTEEYDRGEKLRNYQAIPSVREIVLASHREPRLTLFRRQAEGAWLESEHRAGESLVLGAVGAVLAVDDVYRDGLEDALPLGHWGAFTPSLPPRTSPAPCEGPASRRWGASLGSSRQDPFLRLREEACPACGRKRK